MSFIIIALILGLVLGVVGASNGNFLQYYLIGWSISFLSTGIWRHFT
jgi:hypothetical protein